MNKTLEILFWCLLTTSTLSIKFTYHATKHQHFCFDQSAQKQSRYQILVRSSKPTFSLQIFEGQSSIYEDERADTYLKQYSAFTRSSDSSSLPIVLTFCIANKDFQNKAEFDIEFYHGLHLENDYAQQSDFSEVEEKIREVQFIQTYVKTAYVMNTRYLENREQTMISLGAISIVGTITFILVLFMVRIIVSYKVTKYMKMRKLI